MKQLDIKTLQSKLNKIFVFSEYKVIPNTVHGEPFGFFIEDERVSKGLVDWIEKNTDYKFGHARPSKDGLGVQAFFREK